MAIAKETGRRLGMGTNMYPSSTLLGQDKDESIAAFPVDELIEKADSFAWRATIIFYFYVFLFFICCIPPNSSLFPLPYFFVMHHDLYYNFVFCR